MCGYIGIYGKKIDEDFPLKNRVAKLLNTFKYRGPDQSEIISAENTILGFNRLAINNLSSGIQPVRFKKYSNCDKHSLLCFNGEVKNLLSRSL